MIVIENGTGPIMNHGINEKAASRAAKTAMRAMLEPVETEPLEAGRAADAVVLAELIWVMPKA